MIRSIFFSLIPTPATPINLNLFLLKQNLRKLLLTELISTPNKFEKKSIVIKKTGRPKYKIFKSGNKLEIFMLKKIYNDIENDKFDLELSFNFKNRLTKKYNRQRDIIKNL